MNTYPLPSTDLHDAARRRAEELRSQAFDEVFHSGADAFRRALRASRRLAGSLARHRRLRALEA